MYINYGVPYLCIYAEAKAFIICNDFYPVFKWIQRLFRPSCLFQSRDRMAGANTRVTSLLVWLDAIMILERYGLYSLMKHCKYMVLTNTTNTV